jgi:hypothetical protein
MARSSCHCRAEGCRQWLTCYSIPCRAKLLLTSPSSSKVLYAALPGTGPAGETCGSCKNIVRRQWDKIYLKCGLCRDRWTKGPGTDIKARSPACSKWADDSDY